MSNRNLIIPIHYINNFGLNACLVFDEFLKRSMDREAPVGQNNIAWVHANKSSFTSDSSFIDGKIFTSGLNTLFEKGFLIRKKISGKRTSIYAINILNIVLFDRLGPGLYFDSLVLCDGKKLYDAYLIPANIIENIDVIPEFNGHISYCNKRKMLDCNCNLDSLKRIVRTVYNFDLYNMKSKLQKCGEEVKLSLEKISTDEVFPKYIKTIAFPESFDLIESFNGYVFNSIEESTRNPIVVNFDYDKEVSVDNNLDGNDVTEGVKEPAPDKIAEESLKDLARKDYDSYCKYMMIEDVMKKEISEWNARDFVSYLFCGKAKQNQLEGKEFEFPDFARHCAAMKKLYELHGKKKLAGIIFHLVKFNDNIREIYRIKTLSVSISTLSTEWIVNHILNYMEMRRNRIEEDKLNKINKELENKKRTYIKNNEEKKEEVLENYNDGGKLEVLRQKYSGEQNGNK